MARNKIKDLRDSLFETLERLMDNDDPMDLARAKTIADVAQTVINSAKVEIDFMKVSGQIGTDWFADEGKSPLLGFADPNATPKQIAAAVVPQPRATEPKIPALDGVSKENYADLCLVCPLPSCDDTSPKCLIQIERRKPAQAAA